MKTNMIPADGLTGTQTFILMCMALGVAVVIGLIIVGICKLVDLISKRLEEWKKSKSKN